MNDRLKPLPISYELKLEIEKFYLNCCLSSNISMTIEDQDKFFELIERISRESKCGGGCDCGS